MPTAEGGITDRIARLGRLVIRLRWPFRPAWLDATWAVFSTVNLIAIFTFAGWETIPLHFIWISFTLVYGFRTPGTGLGLALVRAVARAHTGQVLVTSHLGQGSEFELLLPGPPGPLALSPTAPTEADAAGGRLARKPLRSGLANS